MTLTRAPLRLLGIFALTLLCVGAGNGTPLRTNTYGLLIMAHGGTEEWNAGVRAAVEPLRQRWPVAIAFGMADAISLEDAVRELEDHGAARIGVIRVFVSGDSWLERTEQILGLVPGAPPKPAAESRHGHGGGTASHAEPAASHGMAFYRLPTRASYALSTEGLMDTPRSGDIIAERAARLSSNPGSEDVLILAHGPGDDASNRRWLASLESRADAVRQVRPFRRVHVETLSEDWAEPRAAAELRIRAFVQRASDENGRALVIPFRLFGFGPYAEVLAGLTYQADGAGLLPHEAVTTWLTEQAEQLAEGPFREPYTEQAAAVPAGAMTPRRPVGRGAS